MTNSDDPGRSSPLWAPRFAGSFAVVIGCLVLGGWIFEIETLKSLIVGLVSMKANTAISMILLGLAVYRIESPTSPPGYFRAATLLALLVFVLGFATLLQDLFGLEFGIDQLFLRESSNAPLTGHPGRMAPFTALSFMVLAAAVICWQCRQPVWTQILALILLPVLLLPLTGYLLGDPAFPRLGNFTVIAAHTAVTFLILSTGLLFVTDDVGILAKLGDKLEKIIFNSSLLLLTACALASGANALRLAEHGSWLIQSYRLTELTTNIERQASKLIAASNPAFLPDNQQRSTELNQAIRELENDLAELEQSNGQFNNLSQTLTEPLTQLKTQLRRLIPSDPRTDMLSASATQAADGETAQRLAVEISNLIGSLQTFVSEQQVLKQNQIALSHSSTMVSLLVTWLISLILFLASRNQLKREILKRKQSEQMLAESLVHSQMLVDSAQDAMICLDDRGRIRHWNSQAEKLFGYTKQQVLDNEPTDLIVPPELRLAYRQELRRCLETGSPDLAGKHLETQAMAADGSLFPLELTLSTCNIEGRDFVIAYARDISDRKHLQQQLWHQANYDRLTDLPKRQLFFDRLSRAISRARRINGYVGVLFLDLDGFKQANDQFGHQAGDQVLQTATKRWQSCLRDNDTLARIGGDEFAVIVANLESKADAALIADKLIESLRQRIDLPNHQHCRVGVSIGIAIYPEHAREMDSLLSAADSAMYQSKSGGKNTFRFSSAVADQSNQALHWLQFDDSHLVGVDEIDDQHRHLVRLVNQLNHAIVDHSDQLKNNRLLQKIIAFAVFHFATEHRLMEAYRYPNIAQHDQEHGALTNDIQSFAEEFRQGNEVLLLQFLKDWLLNHIQHTDKALGEFINSHAPPSDGN